MKYDIYTMEHSVSNEVISFARKWIVLNEIP